ncbi:metallopeptidase (family M50) [Skeletonema marinoi]|uniref:Metallopeptidase (Family M50) n=1 Tax=Skeletonema marinoi TaxID=267567 RepID=A0AAD8XS13_9STRA|nr:metallopeptidase (family M50) [Skeletonema marinoi]
MPKPNWTLSCCCGDEEVIFIAFLFGYLLANFFLWNNLLLRPIKLIAIFVHEMSHALACWLTGGTVLNNRIEVKERDGGITRYEGGNAYFVLSAGYIGSAFFGMLFIILSGDRIASLVAACIFLFGLVISLYLTKKSETESRVWTVGLSMGFIALTTVFICWIDFSSIHYCNFSRFIMESSSQALQFMTSMTTSSYEDLNNQIHIHAMTCYHVAYRSLRGCYTSL